MKAIFFGSSEFSVPFLCAIHNSIHNISLVVTGTDKEQGRGKRVLPNPVKECAESLNLCYLEVDDLNDRVIENIAKKEFDCFVIVSFRKILPEKLLNIAKEKTINLHPSILPKYRGSSPIINALINGDTRTGISIIRITREIDAGDVYLMTEFAIAEDDNKDALEEKIISIGIPLLIKVMDLIETGKITVFPQSKKNISYTGLFSKDELKIDWNRSADEIKNKVRAFSSSPGCFTNWKGKNIKVLNTSVCKDTKFSEFLKNKIRNGTIICAERSGLFVKCGKKGKNNKHLIGTVVKIETLKPQGKNVMTFIDFINGYRIKPGDLFE